MEKKTAPKSTLELRDAANLLSEQNRAYFQGWIDSQTASKRADIDDELGSFDRSENLLSHVAMKDPSY